MSQACVDKIIYGISEIQIKLYKSKYDDTLCLCKKHLLDLFGKRLQHLLMLTASVKYLNNNWHIEFDNMITKLKNEIEQSIANDDIVSPIIESMYLDIIRALLRRFPILTDKLFNIKSYTSFISMLISRILKVYDMIYLLFKVTYPVCTDFSKSCTDICVNTCINKGLFSHTTILIPTASLKQFGKFEQEVYDIILFVMNSYTKKSNLNILVCGPYWDSVKLYLTTKGFKENQITVTNNCPIPLESLKIKQGAFCYV